MLVGVLLIGVNDRAASTAKNDDGPENMFGDLLENSVRNMVTEFRGVGSYLRFPRRQLHFAHIYRDMRSYLRSQDNRD